MKKLASALGFLAIVSASLPGNAPAVKAQSCNYYTGISVTGQKVNLDTCSISKSSDRGTSFIYYLGDKKFASRANCNDRTWTQESNTEDRSIAQASECGYEDDIIKAKCLSASFIKDVATVNIVVQNKSKKDVFLAETYGGSATYVVLTSDSGQSSTCRAQGIKSARADEKNSSAFSRLKPGGKITISGVSCQGLDPSTTRSVSFNVDLTIWEKEQNSQLTISLTGIPIKKISTR
jgi:hypothetical protein